VHADIIEAKLIAVPKDSRGPRLICVHPAESIWIQQGCVASWNELSRSIELVMVRGRKVTSISRIRVSTVG
jgi:hypothetical protein